MRGLGKCITWNEYIHSRSLGQRLASTFDRHLRGWSELGAPEVVLGPAPFSTGGEVPHFPSDSNGSSTWTPPSVSPSANWFGSDGCAAMTRGYTLKLLKLHHQADKNKQNCLNG